MEPLETERLVIRALEMTDLEPVQQAVWADPKVAVPFGGRTRSLEETRQWLIARIWQVTRDQATGYYAVVRKEDRKLIGVFTLSMFLAHFLRLEGDPDPERNALEVELGYAIGTAYQRRGYATEAGKALIQYAFEKLKLRRLISGAEESANPASYHLARKLGFRMVRNTHPRWAGMVGVLYNPSVTGQEHSAEEQRSG
jgi:ribosomal-protein-alanine N-acetyltransferase